MFYTCAMARQMRRSRFASIGPLFAVLVCGVSPRMAWHPAVAMAQSGREGVAPRRGGNPEAAKIANPVPATPESVTAGRRAYGQLCANCHGPSGKGDRSTAGADQPSDLTDGVWDFGSTDGEIFTVIRDGLSGKDMGGYAERLKETDIWN